MPAFKFPFRFSAVAVLLTASFSCNDSSSLSSKDKKSDDKEDDDADTPVEVSGSFLTCDWVDEPTEGKEAVIGCAVTGKDGEALDRKDRSFDLTLHNNDNTAVDMVTTDSPAESDWHKLAKLPATHHDTGYLKMAMKKEGVQEGSFILNTFNIGKSIRQGNQAEYDETSGDEGTLTSITTHGQWADKLRANVSIKMSDFCEANGTVRSSLTMESEVMVTLADEFLKTSTANKNITVKDTAISNKSDACFVEFREMGGSKKIVHENKQQTCFYLNTGSNLHIISVKKAVDENPAFNFENLKKFASSKACP